MTEGRGSCMKKIRERRMEVGGWGGGGGGGTGLGPGGRRAVVGRKAGRGADWIKKIHKQCMEVGGWKGGLWQGAGRAAVGREAGGRGTGSSKHQCMHLYLYSAWPPCLLGVHHASEGCACTPSLLLTMW